MASLVALLATAIAAAREANEDVLKALHLSIRHATTLGDQQERLSELDSTVRGLHGVDSPGPAAGQ